MSDDRTITGARELDASIGQSVTVGGITAQFEISDPA